MLYVACADYKVYFIHFDWEKKQDYLDDDYTSLLDHYNRAFLLYEM